MFNWNRGHPDPGRAVFCDDVLWVMLTASFAAFVVSLWTSGSWLLACSWGGCLCTLVTLGLAVARMLPRSARKASGWFGLLFALLLLLAHTRVESRVGRLFGWMLDGRPVGAGLMKSLGLAIRGYAGEHGIYPESLAALVDGEQGLVHPKNLVSPLDPGCEYLYSYNDWPAGLIYSSYIYQAGKGPWLNDPHIVLAYEQSTWQPMDLRVFPEYGRFVLFGDGRVELLDPLNFSSVLRDDAVRRRELDWPRQMSRPVGEPPVATASKPTTER